MLSSRLAANDTPTVPATPDLLAGLASQNNDEEEDVPDWLVSLTGNAPGKKKKNEPEAEDTKVKWVELGGQEDVEEPSPSIGATQKPSETPVQNTTPSWMMPQEPAPEKDELADWLSLAGQPSASPSDQSSALSQPAESSNPVFPTSKPEDMDWLRNLESKPVVSESASAAQSPDQPKDFDLQSHTATTPPPASDVPDWLSNLQAQQPAFDLTLPPAQEEQAAVPPQPIGWELLEPVRLIKVSPAASGQVPDWLKAFGQAPTTAEPSASLGSSSNMPDWLKAAAPQSTADVPPVSVPPATLSSPDVDKAPIAFETPDWLSSIKPAQPQSSMPPADLIAPTFTTHETPQPSSPAPAFTDNPAAAVNMDSLFASMQAPDWLNTPAPKSADQTSGETNPPPAAQKGEAIAPAELPSWVQAMRPVESALPLSSTSGSDSSVEAGGPLAGLQNILPAGPGFRPTSKPKAYSIKLNATNEHQTQAALLEQILAAETAPIPMKASSVIMSQKILRWVITALILLFVGGIFFAGTQIFAVPDKSNDPPNGQIEMAISAIGKIPPSAPGFGCI